MLCFQARLILACIMHIIVVFRRLLRQLSLAWPITYCEGSHMSCIPAHGMHDTAWHGTARHASFSYGTHQRTAIYADLTQSQ